MENIAENRLKAELRTGVTSCERNGASRRFQSQYRRLAPSRSQNPETTRFAVFFTWDPSRSLGTRNIAAVIVELILSWILARAQRVVNRL
jgi:hypothetical protein